jgi:Kef-type K+ transport system membrane component KefB
VKPTHLRSVGKHAPLITTVVAAFAVAVHLGLAGYAVTNWHWSLAAIASIAIALTGKVLLALGYRRVRTNRQLAQREPDKP